MPVTKKDGYYNLDFYPEGKKGKRVVRRFKTKKEALQYQKDVLAGKTKPEKADNRKLSEFIQIWHDLHGQNLKSAHTNKQSLTHLCQALGDPVLRLLSVSDYAVYRSNRLESGISQATLNRQLTVLKSMYRELKRLGVIDFDFPALAVRNLKHKKTELSFLTHENIQELKKAIGQSSNESLPYVFKLALATGARWSECEGVKHENLHNGGVYFTDTKNGHSRFVPLSAGLFALIKARLNQGGFTSCYGAFRSAFKRSGIPHNKGQLAHILRHTFASHFVMAGGNLLTLQKILGHSSIEVTMIYSHLAPEFLNQAVQFNPLENRPGVGGQITSVDK